MDFLVPSIKTVNIEKKKGYAVTISNHFRIYRLPYRKRLCNPYIIRGRP